MHINARCEAASIFFVLFFFCTKRTKKIAWQLEWTIRQIIKCVIVCIMVDVRATVLCRWYGLLCLYSTQFCDHFVFGLVVAGAVVTFLSEKPHIKVGKPTLRDATHVTVQMYAHQETRSSRIPLLHTHTHGTIHSVVVSTWNHILNVEFGIFRWNSHFILARTIRIPLKITKIMQLRLIRAFFF